MTSRQAARRERTAVKELPARKLGIPPDRTGAGGMVNTEVLDHAHRDFPRLVPPRRDPVLGRHPPPGRPFSFSQTLRGSPWAWGTANESHFGLAYGGGVEWIVFPHVTIRAEYLAANFGSVNHNFIGQAYSGTVQVSPGPPLTYDYRTDSYNHDLTFQAVRGAISFKY